MATLSCLRRSTCLRTLCLTMLIAATTSAQMTDDRVRRSLEDGVRFLKVKQEEDGSWPDYDYSQYPAGVSSLCTLALLNAGLKPKDPVIQKALTYLRKQTELERTYSVALQTLVLCTAEPNKDLFLIKRNVAWLQGAQRKGAIGKGSWGYSSGNTDEDPSNCQFALLALYEAERVGVPVKEETWRLALAYWQRTQRQDGSFAYDDTNAETPSTGSMTCAGIGSMIIAAGHVSQLDATINNGQVQCCGGELANESDDAIERALSWLGNNFSVKRNPSTRKLEGTLYHYYYLYALERVGRLAGRRFIGEHDWYREGVEELLDLQDNVSGFWNSKAQQLVSTSFAVLFLSKGRRPILMAKIKRQPTEDWNHHGHDAAHLTSYVEKRWKQDLTWQVVDLEKATADDLFQSPVLFISGRDALDVAQAEKDALKKYVEMGGFIFAENCCEGDGFDRDFRALMGELFPDTQLELLPPKHPIWFAEQRVNPKYLRRLEGIDACCRTGVVYCPENLSCYWELAAPQRSKQRKLSPAVLEEIKACLAIGANVVTYATGRELRQKLDNSGYVSIVKRASQNRASLYVAKLDHNGGGDEAPSALSNVLAVVAQQTRLPVAVEKRLLSPTDSTLRDYPVAFVHGRRSFRWGAAKRNAIRRFVDDGGVLFADAICANEEFAASFRNEMQAIFGDRDFKRIPPEHPMFTTEFHGHDIRTVTLRDPRSRTRNDDPLSVRTERIAPLLEGIEEKGRFVVMFSPHDMSCALENRPSLECRGYTREDAAKLATNILLYALQQ